MSIFQPTSPLHDGAVIVQDDRVAAAACFLPLTVNPKLSKELGSRHRAAIGLTEENDAVAIVISEETGAISVVADGQIERGFDADALRARLRSLVLQRRAAGPRRDHGPVVHVMSMSIWPFRHFGLKVLSLGLALSLWMVVSGEETVERSLRVPLELQQFPQGLELQGDPASTIDVRVRGSSGALARIAPGDIVAVLDLRGARAGNRLFHLTPDQVRAPFGIEVVAGQPGTISMAFERSKTARVQIRPAIDGKPAPGLRRRAPGRPIPPAVEVVGPESAVDRATEALTEPVSVAGRQSGGHRHRHRRPPRSRAAPEERALREGDGPDRPVARRADAARSAGASAEPRDRARRGRRAVRSSASACAAAATASPGSARTM